MRFRFSDDLGRATRLSAALETARFFRTEGADFDTIARGGCVFFRGLDTEESRATAESIGDRSNGDYEWLP
jgi:hypothetical protein